MPNLIEALHWIVNKGIGCLPTSMCHKYGELTTSASAVKNGTTIKNYTY